MTQNAGITGASAGVGRAAARLLGRRGASVTLVARAAYGAGLLCAPGPAIQLGIGGQPDSRTCAVARVLGARHLAQAGVTAACPSRAVLLTGAGTDLAHAASMLAVAAVDRRKRRASLADAATATTFAAAGLITARSSGSWSSGSWAAVVRRSRAGGRRPRSAAAGWRRG